MGRRTPLLRLSRPCVKQVLGGGEISRLDVKMQRPRARKPDLTRFGCVPILQSPADYGQVAQLVERGPEKAGVGGSIPSLATIKSRQNLNGKRQKDWSTSILPAGYCLSQLEKAESRNQKAEGRRQKAVGRNPTVKEGAEEKVIGRKHG